MSLHLLLVKKFDKKEVAHSYSYSYHPEMCDDKMNILSNIAAERSRTALRPMTETQGHTGELGAQAM
jgi:hypothetical protein